MKHEETKNQDFSTEDLELIIEIPGFNEEIKEKLLDVARNLGNHGCTKSYIEDLFNPDSSINAYLRECDMINVRSITLGIDHRGDLWGYGNGYSQDFYEEAESIVIDELDRVNQALCKNDQLSEEYYSVRPSNLVLDDWIDQIPLDEWKEAFLCAVVEDE